MSPAAKAKPKAQDKLTFAPVTVKGIDREAKEKSVQIFIEKSRVAVQWMIGTPVFFTPAELKLVIEQTEQINKPFPDIVMSLEDSDKHAFVAHIAGGRLYADEKYGDSFPSVSWPTIKKALNDAIKFLSTVRPER